MIRFSLTHSYPIINEYILVYFIIVYHAIIYTLYSTCIGYIWGDARFKDVRIKQTGFRGYLTFLSVWRIQRTEAESPLSGPLYDISFCERHNDWILWFSQMLPIRDSHREKVGTGWFIFKSVPPLCPLLAHSLKMPATFMISRSAVDNARNV